MKAGSFAKMEQVAEIHCFDLFELCDRIQGYGNMRLNFDFVAHIESEIQQDEKLKSRSEVWLCG